MATLNGIEIHVINESVPFEVQIPTRPVEKGKDIADHIKKTARRLTLTGQVVGPDAGDKRNQIWGMAERGDLVVYDGRNAAYTMLIKSMPTEHDYKIANGFRFTLELEEARIVTVTQSVPESTDPTGTAAAATGNQGMQQLEQKTSEVYATIKSGDTFWSLAGTFKTTTAAIQALNAGVDPRKLQVGQKVRVV